MIGLRALPYNACQSMMWAEEVVRGDPSDPSNVFYFTDVRLNLPGMDSYDRTPDRIGSAKGFGTMVRGLWHASGGDAEK